MIKFFNYFTILTLTICLAKTGKKMMPKTKMRMKKFGRMNLIFEFLHIKIRLYDNLHENLRIKSLTHF